MKDCRLRVLLERLAALEHEQWMCWARAIMKQEKLSEERVRWLSNMVPYEQLPEDVKEYNRKWVRKVLEVIKEFLRCSMEGGKGCRLSLRG